MNSRIFSVCAPPHSFVGTYFLHPPDAREMLLINYVMHVLIVIAAVAQIRFLKIRFLW